MKEFVNAYFNTQVYAKETHEEDHGVLCNDFYSLFKGYITAMYHADIITTIEYKDWLNKANNVLRVDMGE